MFFHVTLNLEEGPVGQGKEVPTVREYIGRSLYTFKIRTRIHFHTYIVYIHHTVVSLVGHSTENLSYTEPLQVYVCVCMCV